MALIQKRMRQGAMTTDIALLATRVAAAFDATPEGASLRAALPTLRRSVGLCARCGQPYTGIADACPTLPRHQLIPRLRRARHRQRPTEGQHDPQEPHRRKRSLPNRSEP